MSSGFDVHGGASNDLGFCSRVDDRGFYDCDVNNGKTCVFKPWDVHGAAFLGSCIVLAIWARKQHAFGTSGFYTDGALIIFPVHMDLLITLGVICLCQGCQVVLMDHMVKNQAIEVVNIIANILLFSLGHGVTEGITALLLMSSIGTRAMKRSFFMGMFSSLFVTLTYAISTSDEAGYPVFSRRSTNELFDTIRDVFFCALYLFLWLAPNACFSTSRRPALLFWARFWGILKLLILTCLLLMDHVALDEPFCIYHLCQFFGNEVLKLWVTYETFVLEARYWYGVDTRANGGLCAGALCLPCERWGLARRSENLEPRPDTEAALLPEEGSNSDDESRRSSLGQTITRPFRNLALSPESALSMTKALEGHHNQVAVPRIDFTRLRLASPSRMLGAGSSARVYVGRWCGRAVAVKMLFTMELTPEEINRTCEEAALLHRLQAVSSPHIVRFHGIAMLPPSLCVVLELCSEGSLFDLLQGSSGSASRIPWGHRIELALGASRGVEALASALPGFSHNDLKSVNFLVHCPANKATNKRARGGSGESNRLGSTEKAEDRSDRVPSAREASREPLHFIVKLADLEFASAGIVPPHMLIGETPNWTAPEVLSGTAVVTPASDVFALAMVLFEVIACEVPFASEESNPYAVAAFIKAGRRPKFPPLSAAGGDPLERSQQEAYRTVVEGAWAQDPAARPTASAVVKALHRLHVANRAATGADKPHAAPLLP